MKALYTGTDENNAQNRAQEQLDIVNENLHQYNPYINWDTLRRLTADPEIEGVTYYWMFEKPAPNIEEGYSADLEAAYDPNWFIPEEL